MAGDNPPAAGVKLRVEYLVPVLEVDDDLRGAAGRENVFVEPRPPAGTELCRHVVAIQLHLIIPRARLLARVGKGGRVVLPSRRGIETPDRHHQYVAKVIAARAAEVGVAESVNQRIRVMVAAATVPVAAVGTGVRAELHHTEWVGGTREGVPVEIRPHEGVDKGDQGGQQGQERNFHCEKNACHTPGC